MRRTISSRWTTAIASRDGDQVLDLERGQRAADLVERGLYRSSVASAWFARDRMAAESSRTCRGRSRTGR
jgi:hypothetical protein